jgi:outer membrane lipoprotein-sorting protein
MKFSRPFFLCSLLMLAGAGQLARAADLPVGPATLLADPAHDPAWTQLFAKLASNKTRQSQFEERRYFPFRSTPVVLQGEIRIVPERGLSLRYTEPEHRILIVDAKGLLMRDDEGRERAAPSDSRAQAVTSAMVDVLRFDLAALQKSFVMYGRQEGTKWVLGFVPRDASLAEMIGTLFVSGDQTVLDRIEMTKSATQRIEILIRNTREDVVFPGDVLERFFR